MAIPIAIQGTVKADGTLELDDKVPLPAGRVQVLVQPLAPKTGSTLEETMERIWASQRARGFAPRSVEEVEAERRAMRDESEEEILEAIRIYEECQRAKQSAGQPMEP